MWELFLGLDFEHRILIVLFLIAYISAMLIQVNDKKFEVTWVDWIAGFMTSALGGTIMYFGIMSWANIGVKWAATIVVSLLSYRTIKYIVAPPQQDQFAQGIWKGIMDALKRLFNIPLDKN